ncbi:hypothetical protein AAHA92_06438 [Salvia divinorum]|uniref:Uncharacterized protein n=1 Tax=Salvia divinorum TaxID=28513 RepID=A0ABD1I887_SALDI
MLHIYSTRFAIHGSFFLREKGNAIDEDWFQSPKLRPKRKTGEEFASDERLNRGERMIEYVMKRGKCVKEGRLLNRQKGIFILER